MIMLDEISKDCIKLFYEPNNSIFGFGSIKPLYKLTKTQVQALKQIVYQSVDKEELHAFLRSKQARYRNKIRNSKPIKYSEETKRKQSASINKFWNSIKGTERETALKEISRSSMHKINNNRLNQTDVAKQKRVESRKSNNTEWHTKETRHKMSKSNTGKKRSDDTKQRLSDAAVRKFASGWRRQNYVATPETRRKISEVIKKAWEDCVYTKSDHLFVSNSEIDLRRILVDRLHLSVLANKLRWGKSWDVICESLMLIIEFNGTYWHFDPRIYVADYYCPSRKIYAKEIWERDLYKTNLAETKGYKLVQIWEADWKLLSDDNEKAQFLTKILKQNNII